MNAYRSDIDGLRAIAVISVVAFHFDSAWVPGGFVGVDMFFVISGFLITGNIHREYSEGCFSIADFYRRRIRRILPALSAVVLGSLVAGHFILMPAPLVELAWSAVAAQFSLANVYFTYFLDTSYFAPDASLQPLLHLWSLGVEEQFYLVWPLLLIAAVRFLSSSMVIAAATVAIAASFGLAQALVVDHPMFAYYMLPTRAGQLLAGAVCFFVLQRIQPERPARCVLTIVGVALVTWSFVSLSEDLAFPGWNAVPIALGTAVLIIAGVDGGSTPFHRMLTLRPIVAVGLVSYSMYLWHWPLLAFARYMHGELTLEHQFAVAVLLVLVSWSSWAFIEQPFRRSAGGLKKVAFRQFVAPAALICGGAGLVLATDGLGLFGTGDYAEQIRLAQTPEPASQDPNVCQRQIVGEHDLSSARCVINGNMEPHVLLWGDSNAAHYVRVLAEVARSRGFAFRNVAHSACPPVLERPERFASAKYRISCEHSVNAVRRVLDKYDVLVLSASWDTYFNRFSEFESSMVSSLEILSAGDRRIILLGRIPRFAAFDPDCGGKAVKLPFIDCESRSRGPLGNIEEINQRVEAIANRFPSVRYADFNSALCDATSCSTYVGSRNVYFDKSHLSRHGAIVLGRRILESGVNLSTFDGLATQQPRKETSVSIPAVADKQIRTNGG